MFIELCGEVFMYLFTYSRICLFSVPASRVGITARGGSATAASFNSRAQGLYDPRDPKGT